MIWQLKQWPNYQMNSTTMYPQSIRHYPCFLFPVSQHQSNHPQQLRKSVRIAKKTPCNYLPFWHNISQSIKTGMGYCRTILSTSTCRNYFGRPEHWNSQISPGEKPSHPATTRKTQNKTLQHSWKNAATPKSSQATTRWNKGHSLHTTLHWREGCQQAPYTEGWSFWSRSSVPWATTVALA